MNDLHLLSGLLVFLIFRRITLCFGDNTKERILLVVYVDDIIIIDNNAQEIADLKCYLKKYFQIKDLQSLHYFLGIEVI